MTYKLTWDFADSRVAPNGTLGDKVVVVHKGSAPNTLNGATKTTSSFGIKIMGDVQLEGGPQLGCEMSWQRTKERVVYDVEIVKALEGCLPGWDLVMTNPKSLAAKGTLSYEVEWVWAINKQAAEESKLYVPLGGNPHQKFSIRSRIEALYKPYSGRPFTSKVHNIATREVRVPHNNVFKGAKVSVAHDHRPSKPA